MIQAIRGTKDILPDTISHWYYVEETARKVSELFGYKEIRTPIFEKTEVFARGVGEQTDIVNKEMYTFTDRGGDSITLRPEMTAALVRAVIQNSLVQQQAISRLWYFGAFFRYERPQKGRLRQFHQFGAECISSPYPESDAEIIHLAATFCKALGIQDYLLLINTLGNENSRSEYRKVLVDYLSANKNHLSSESKNRLETNPLRVLDSKDEQDREVISNAPNILDCLDEKSRQHFQKVLEILDYLNIPYKINSRLVRGLDYYSHTVFELQHNSLGAQDSFGGGGRYNSLFSQLGGKDTPAVGFAMGVERLLLILESIGKLPAPDVFADYYIVSANSDYSNIAFKIAEKFRLSGKRVICDVQRRSMKAQMREAGKLNIPYVIIIAEEELKQNAVVLKNMSDGSQQIIEIDKL
ncbi:MAG TPA: histidine--tRNA ligase [Candidatus Kapabacteria bacterium]|nr:histidine--tRNA ligase [Candidatus Kapabacteria bacterium]